MKRATKKIVLFLGLLIMAGSAIFAFYTLKPRPTPEARLAAEREVFARLLANPSYAASDMQRPGGCLSRARALIDP